MSFFKRLFNKNTDKSYYNDIAKIQTGKVSIPKIKRKRVSFGKCKIGEKLGELSQARPKRLSVLLEALENENANFYAFIATSSENKSWLVERLGREDNIHDINWSVVQSKKVFPKFGSKFSCLAYNFQIDSRYKLLRRVFSSPSEEGWEALDTIQKKEVFCIILKPEVKLEDDIAKRNFVKSALVGEQYPGLIDAQDEGTFKAYGPFSPYRYKYFRLFYIILEKKDDILSLGKLIGKKKIDLEEALTILYQTGRLLAKLHQNNWVHGKISPYTLFLARNQEENGQIVYLNGYSFLNFEKDLESTYCNIIKNAPLTIYSAPEQLKGEISAKTDQFQLALTLYHLISDRNPFLASSEMLIKKRINKFIIKPLHKITDIPEWFSCIIEKMMSQDPEERFNDFEEIFETILKTREEYEFQEGEEIVTTQKEEKKEEKAKKTVIKNDQKATPEKKDEDPKEEEFEEGDFEEFVASDSLNMDYYLICPPNQPMRLDTLKEFKIGRGKENDLVLASDDVSRFHSSIFWSENVFIIKDLESSNGTHVNDKAVKEHFLEVGDTIRIGNTTITFQEIQKGNAIDQEDKLVVKRTMQLKKMKKIDTQKTMSGDLSQISLWQILQILAAEEKSGCLVIGEGIYKIYFSQGRVVHSESKEIKGHEAFYESLFCQEGRFEFDTKMGAAEVTMSDFVESLLLEGARRIDEQQRAQENE